jgi:RHS repeat-associated protein
MRIFTRAVVLFGLPLSAWAANLDTAFVSQSVPAEMIAGQSVPVSVTLKNTGVWGWGPSSGHALGSQNPQNNTNWGLSRVPSTVWLGPGSNVTFNFNATAPATPGTYNFQWRMVHDATFGWFGATTPNVAVQVVTPGAEFVSQTVPSAMDPGQTYSVSVTMKNTGSTAWSPGSYKLGSQNPQDNTTWGPSRVELAASVAPGNNGTFTFNVTAPSTPGSYDFQWRMVNSSFGWFGDSSTNVAVNVVTPGAAFVSQTVPSTMTPGQTYQVSVTMENTGASTWTAGSYRLGGANPLDNIIWRATRVELASAVAPGNNGVFTFDVVAPTTAGAYNFQWRMVFDAFDWFGAMSANVQVAVGSASGLDFVHVDHLDTPRLIANASGQTVWRWDNQEPFGNNPPDENPSGLGAFEFDLRFPGHVWSKETQTAYNGHRDAYDPAIGRYPQSDPIGLEGAWSKLYAYRPRYLDVRAGRYVQEHPDRMDDPRFALIQGSMLFRRPLLVGAIPMAQEFNTYAYANLDPLKNFDISGLQAQSFDPPKGGSPSPWTWSISEYELCLAKSCAAGTIAGGIVGKWAGAVVGFAGGFFLGGYFCPGDPINLSPAPPPGNTPPSAPPKSN